MASQEIPKVIHYCWFGGTPLPESAIKYIRSWKKYCPEYEIKEWNESNFDINCCVYVKEAYQAKKWAFVSDYARYWILYHEGGVYFDTDVEIIQSIEDLVEEGSFMGCEVTLISKKVSSICQIQLGIGVNPGLGLSAKPGLELYKQMLEFYEHKHFINTDGSYDLTTVVEYTTSLLKKAGLVKSKEIQCIEDIYIYPPEYFAPMDYTTGKITLTKNTRTIHHYNASWKSDKEQNQSQVLQKLNSRFGHKYGYIIWKLYILPYRLSEKIRHKGLRGTVIFFFNKVLKH